jgi:hypothetical protein
MGTERHKFDDTCGHHIANEVTEDINVTGELATNRIFRHGDTGQIVFVDMRRSSLSITEITKDLACSTLLVPTDWPQHIQLQRWRETHSPDDGTSKTQHLR